MTLKKEIEDILHPEKKKLHPPLAPKPYRHEEVKSHAPPILDEEESSSLFIDFSYLTNNTSFRRGIMEFIKKYIPGFENVDPRASNKVMTQQFNENYRNYKAVMAEFMEKVKKRNEG